MVGVLVRVREAVVVRHLIHPAGPGSRWPRAVRHRRDRWLGDERTLIAPHTITINGPTAVRNSLPRVKHGVVRASNAQTVANRVRIVSKLSKSAPPQPSVKTAPFAATEPS